MGGQPGGAAGNVSKSRGFGSTHVFQAKVVNVNPSAWTVDVVSQFDDRTYPLIQVGSPYLHYNNGEGLFAMPEVGSVCMVCLPADSSPAFVLTYLAPLERSGVTGKTTDGKSVQEAVFHAGRPQAMPGDIFLRTRDGNFVTLRRGGVLEIGATELAQRIFIPIGNLVLDISGEYQHFNTGGSVVWGLQEGPVDDTMPTRMIQTFRVYADDKYADIRIVRGNVTAPLEEPGGSATVSAIARTGMSDGKDKENPLVYELVVSRGGFNAQNGEVVRENNPKDNSTLRFMYDMQGNVFFRSEGDVVLALKHGLTFVAGSGFSCKSKVFSVESEGEVNLKSEGTVNIRGETVKIGPGTSSVAHVGSKVRFSVAEAPVVGTINGSTSFTGVITLNTALEGYVSSGRGEVLV